MQYALKVWLTISKIFIYRMRYQNSNNFNFLLYASARSCWRLRKPDVSSKYSQNGRDVESAEYKFGSLDTRDQSL